MLLIAGLGQQRTAWPPELLDRLHEAGYRTVCADNRDVGRGHGPRGHAVRPAPRCRRVATVALHPRPHGARPRRGARPPRRRPRPRARGVDGRDDRPARGAWPSPTGSTSLVSVMSTTGARDVGGPTERAKPALTSVPPHGDLDAYVAYQVELQTIIGTRGRPTRCVPPPARGCRSRAASTSGARPGSCWRSAGTATGPTGSRRVPRADAGAPRRGRPAHRRLRRPRDGGGHPGRDARHRPRLGARPARRRTSTGWRRRSSTTSPRTRVRNVPVASVSVQQRTATERRPVVRVRTLAAAGAIAGLAALHRRSRGRDGHHLARVRALDPDDGLPRDRPHRLRATSSPGTPRPRSASRCSAPSRCRRSAASCSTRGRSPRTRASRYDDTELLLAEVEEHGLESDRGPCGASAASTGCTRPTRSAPST